MCQGKSVAAANLANWAINCVKYHKIHVKVAPLMAKVKEATDTKNTAEASHRCAFWTCYNSLDPGQVADIATECHTLEEKLNGAVSETLRLG